MQATFFSFNYKENLAINLPIKNIKISSHCINMRANMGVTFLEADLEMSMTCLKD